ncbi:MAG: hypothetical protein ACK5EU_03470 [Pseudanabaena sp.]|jgi:hypothetical protein|uniref:hypothetical protein n=1 Tax=Pseudanabaena mucicola TaxID=71190 RepID=UPI003957DB8F|nr:hypothetical protein [Pseudanabaena sp. M53BS1SP1A06MG]MCA6583086.1 hypothetical protein [Pseudanabaena sp. M34BS1SP1A06MG]MCA6585987.1 hypothetical protein [Pseudanabaena sp. M051S1SP1A06QC]MCA6593907.1 hypothetical protein [Pseudanabaena sp. M38BS1SP1A06MG]MCA6598050.1 hypothetical protein [Pseudanabaena sp. M046S1SP1A06QC]MCA6601863.1 hypothetical protein [Pseudanabaena sp. M57BS1SP1A06MG]
MTSEAVEEQEVVLCIGDTTYLDYGKIKAKQEGYGSTGNGGNGLISNPLLSLAAILSIVVSLPLIFKSSGVAGLIYATFVKAGFLPKLVLNGKSKSDRSSDWNCPICGWQSD